MRLVNVSTLKLHEFFEDEIPPYAILSHRWGKDEVSYQDYCVRDRRTTAAAGYRKILDTCSFVRKFNNQNITQELKSVVQAVQWAWIDTCCIDKHSSSELSEAINSMFRWYRKAKYCVVFLADVTQPKTSSQGTMQTFKASSWFTRGWTLQELVAPDWVIFCDANWEVVGNLCPPFFRPLFERDWYGQSTTIGPSLETIVSEITGIQPEHLINFNPADTTICVAQKMFWASGRETTRQEDRAYSLLGFFDVNMPLIYGEGNKAFLRLQEEIVKRSTDQSIFAWRGPERYRRRSFSSGMLAPSPDWFAQSGHLRQQEGSLLLDRPYVITNNGIELRVRVKTVTNRLRKYWQKLEDSQTLYVLDLNCIFESGKPFQIAFIALEGKQNHCRRVLLEDFGEVLATARLKEINERLVYVPTFDVRLSATLS